MYAVSFETKGGCVDATPGMRDWDPDFEQIVWLYKPLSKCPRQQRNMDRASIGFVWPPRAHGHHVRGKLARQSVMGMGSMECLVHG